MMNDLMGFVVVENDNSVRQKPTLKVTKRYIRLTTPAIKVIDSEWINVFVDEKRNRVMIKGSQQNTPNSFRMSISGGGTGHMRDAVIGKTIVGVITKVLGEGTYVGYVPEGTQNTIIFEK